MTACSSDEGKDVKKYLRKKYDIEVEVTDYPKTNTNNMGSSSFTVVRKDIPEIEFNVFTDGLFINKITSDNYEEIFGVYQANRKYQKSSIYKNLLESGIHSFVSHGIYISDDYEEVFTAIDIVLLKSNGLEVSDSNYEELYYAFQQIKDFHKENYKLNDIYIADVFDLKINNKSELFASNDFRTITIDVSQINEINNYEEFKRLLENV